MMCYCSLPLASWVIIKIWNIYIAFKNEIDSFMKTFYTANHLILITGQIIYLIKGRYPFENQRALKEVFK